MKEREIGDRKESGREMKHSETINEKSAREKCGLCAAKEDKLGDDCGCETVGKDTENR